MAPSGDVPFHIRQPKLAFDANQCFLNSKMACCSVVMKTSKNVSAQLFRSNHLLPSNTLQV